MLRTPRTRTLPMWLWSASQQRKLRAATPPTARMRSVLRTRPLPGVPFDDRMWINGFNDASHVYMECHDFGTTSQIFVQRSSDGGETYSGALGAAIDAATEPSVGPPTGNIAGQIKVDNSSCSSHGNLYQIFVGPDNPMDNSKASNNFMNAAYVGVASGVSLTSPTLSFTDYKIFSCGAGSTCPSGAGLGNLFPALAVDKFGYVYAVWSDNTTVYYSFSMSQGTSWSPAIKVTQNTSQAGKSNVFPWIAADADGHVAIAWYGADQAGNSNTVPLTTNWNVYVAETVNGHAITPVFTLSQATDHSNHGKSQPAAYLAAPTVALLTFSRSRLTQRAIASTLPTRITMRVLLSRTSRGRRKHPEASSPRASVQGPNNIAGRPTYSRSPSLAEMERPFTGCAANRERFSPRRSRFAYATLCRERARVRSLPTLPES